MIFFRKEEVRYRNLREMSTNNDKLVKRIIAVGLAGLFIVPIQNILNRTNEPVDEIVIANSNEIEEGLDSIHRMDNFKNWEEVESQLEKAFKKNGKLKKTFEGKKGNKARDLIKESIKSAWDNYTEYQLHEKHILPRSVLMKYYIACVEQTDVFELVDQDENSDNRRQLNEEHAAGDNTTWYSNGEKLHRIRVFVDPDNPNNQHEVILHEFVHSTLNNFLLDTDFNKLNIDQDIKNLIIKNKDYIRNMFAEGAAATLSKYAYPYDEYIGEHIYGASDEFGVGYKDDLSVKTHSNVYPTYSYCVNKFIYFSGIDNFTDFLLGKQSFEEYLNCIIKKCGKENFNSIITDIIKILEVENRFKNLDDKTKEEIKYWHVDFGDLDREYEFKGIELDRILYEVNIIKSEESFNLFKNEQVEHYTNELKGLKEENYDDDNKRLDMITGCIEYYTEVKLEEYCQYKSEEECGRKLSRDEFEKYLKNKVQDLKEDRKNILNKKRDKQNEINKNYGDIIEVWKYYDDLERIVLENMSSKINNCNQKDEIVELFQEYCQYKKNNMCEIYSKPINFEDEEFLSKYTKNIEISLLTKFKDMGIKIGEYEFSNNAENAKLDDIVFECILQAETEYLIDGLQVSDSIKYSDEESKKYAKLKSVDKSVLSTYEDDLNEMDHKEGGQIRVLTIKDSNGRITYVRFIKDDNEIQGFYVGNFSSIMMCFKYLDDMEINNKDDFLNFLFLRKELPFQSYP